MLETTTEPEYARKQLKPASILLDLLHSDAGQSRSVRSIMRTGCLFGFSENTLRVTLSRLVSRGLLESPRRGYYRLAESTSALNRFVDDWRLGEGRCRDWVSGEWLICHLSSSVTGATADRELEKSHWVLNSRGFRQTRRNFWVRPDNLSFSYQCLSQQLLELGLAPEALLLGSVGIDAQTAKSWRSAWNTKALEQKYHSALTRLKKSGSKLDSMPRNQAMLESFTLGGEVIHLLAKDPLLPDDWLNTRVRKQLWHAMLCYERQGKAVWADSRKKTEVSEPAHLPRPQHPLAPAHLTAGQIA